MKRSRLAALALLWAVSAHAQSAITVRVDNYVRAESDVSFAGVVKMGGFGKLAHLREPAPLDKRFVVRPNRDTLYSNGIFDLDAGPVTRHAARGRQTLHVNAGDRRGPIHAGRPLRRREPYADERKHWLERVLVLRTRDAALPAWRAAIF